MQKLWHDRWVGIIRRWEGFKELYEIVAVAYVWWECVDKRLQEVWQSLEAGWWGNHISIVHVEGRMEKAKVSYMDFGVAIEKCGCEGFGGGGLECIDFGKTIEKSTQSNDFWLCELLVGCYEKIKSG